MGVGSTGILTHLYLGLNHAPAYLHGIEPKRYTYFPCSPQTHTCTINPFQDPQWDMSHNQMRQHLLQKALFVFNDLNPDLSISVQGFEYMMCFSSWGPGYLVRIRANFIPVVSQVALVNGLKGLVRNWRENPIQPAKGNEKNRKTQLLVMFRGTQTGSGGAIKEKPSQQSSMGFAVSSNDPWFLNSYLLPVTLVSSLPALAPTYSHTAQTMKHCLSQQLQGKRKHPEEYVHGYPQKSILRC